MKPGPRRELLELLTLAGLAVPGLACLVVFLNRLGYEALTARLLAPALIAASCLSGFLWVSYRCYFRVRCGTRALPALALCILGHCLLALLLLGRGI